MTDTTDDDARDELNDATGGDYEYDEAHGGGDTGPDVPAALQEEARRRVDLSPH
ncbi:hypothetical protein QLQ12_16355 [Actinoplanes sp. NEAU-A12]|uniref:DUF5709 domain-containing protein n=1 Tax=Actinoplanes sandaracinus TaxID=3045177 RepID=A0ABT6WKD0_9ACTN|nr:hypothetical protein [Actinoplanes sandaracinus]MDI6100177.1 hypothetical protein [Actinoplanes sandaracinus]